MEKQELKSKWEELARQLGAEVPPEAEQLVEAVAPSAGDVESAESKTARPPSRSQTKQRPTAGWDSLASEFGLPAPPPLVEAVSEPAARVVEVKTDIEPRVAPREEKPRRERTRDEREPRGRRRPPRRRESDAESSEPAAVAEIEAPRAEVKPPRAKVTPIAPSAVEPEERTSRGAAVSLWHKIFGSPADQSAKLSDASKTEDESQRPSPTAEEAPEERQPASIDDPVLARDTDFDEALDINERDAVAGASDEASLAEPNRRPRRRRRRRGGREERSPEKETGEHRRDRSSRRGRADRESDELTVDDDELDSDLVSDDDTGDDGAIDANGESTEGVTRSKSALQRSIPSWDEAIGYIVESNMQSRSQRRQSSHSGSRSHSQRGRTRGRHKK